MKSKVIKRARNIFLTVLVLVFIFMAAGVAYVRFSGEAASQKPPAPKTQTISQPIKKPHKPNPNAPVGVSVVAITSPVKPGENSSATIHTTPQAKCSIEIKYNNVPATDSGLVDKLADDYGSNSWSWTVPYGAAIGKWPVKVTCAYNKHVGVVIGDLVVSR